MIHAPVVCNYKSFASRHRVFNFVKDFVELLFPNAITSPIDAILLTAIEMRHDLLIFRQQTTLLCVLPCSLTLHILVEAWQSQYSCVQVRQSETLQVMSEAAPGLLDNAVAG